MKKRIPAILAVLALSLAVGSGCGKPDGDGERTAETIERGESAQPGRIAGGYSEERDVTPEDLALFNEAMAGLMGVTYAPTKVATQVVAGLNYRFTATATPVVPDPEPYTAQIVIYRALDGTLEVTSIERVG